MRSRHFNLAMAIVISATAHVLLWPAAKRIQVPRLTFNDPLLHSGEVTIVLNDKPEKKSDAPKRKPSVPPKSPEVEPPDQMGESTGKGTGAESAKGEKTLVAPEADQDQAFLSRDPVGMGRIGDPPTFWTGPRGEDGSGGQVGNPQSTPNPAHSASADAAAANQPKASDDSPSQKPPRQSVVRGPEPEVPSVTPPTDVAPPPAKTALVGAAKVDLKQPPVDEIKARGPLVQVADASDGSLHLAPFAGESTLPVPASSTAPPTKSGAPLDRAAVALAPQLPVPIAAVAAPPPPSVDITLPNPKNKQTATPKAAPDTSHEPPSPVAPAPALVTTGDARAPGRDRASADPAQESDSESDPFSKTAVADVLRDGRLEVRQGRKIKTTRPHFLPGSEAAFYANPDATLVLKISIDESGKVKSADIIRSAGSVEIDQPCRVAVYDWWFEPTHNKAGKPVPDVVVFTIHFR